jgi:hypothetical protein
VCKFHPAAILAEGFREMHDFYISIRQAESCLEDGILREQCVIVRGSFAQINLCTFSEGGIVLVRTVVSVSSVYTSLV